MRNLLKFYRLSDIIMKKYWQVLFTVVLKPLFMYTLLFFILSFHTKTYNGGENALGIHYRSKKGNVNLSSVGNTNM